MKSLSIFEDPEFIQRDRTVLEAVGVDSEIASQISMSRMSTRRAVFNKSEENRMEIKLKLSVVARKHGGVGCSFDHKSVKRHHVQGETEQVLGTAMTLSNADGKRLSYLMAFEHTIGETHPEAITTVERVLDDYGLLGTVHAGYITMNSDYALWGASKNLTFNTAVDFNHSIDRLIKRCVKELLPRFSNEAVDEFKKTTKLSHDAKKSLSKAELRSLPDSVEPNLNEFLQSKGVQKIPSYTDVRFRSLYNVIEAMHSGKSTILELVGDQSNPNHRHVANLPNMAFVEALFDLMENAFMPLINFCDSNRTRQGGEYIAETEFLLQYACSDTLADNQFASALKKSLIAAILEQLIGHYIMDDETVPSAVRTRLLPNELVLMYGCLPRKACMLEKVRFILKNGGHFLEAQLVKDFATEKNLKAQAKIQIKKYDAIINDQSEIVEFDSDDSCVSDEDSGPLFTANRSSSSNPPFTSRSLIDKELEKYDNLDISFWKSFKTRKFLSFSCFDSLNELRL